MNIWNNIFLGLIFVLAIAVIFFTSQELKIRSTGQKTIETLEKKTETTNLDIKKIQDGSAPTKPFSEKTIEELGYGELRLKLFDLLYERKKAWFDCKPGNLNVSGKVLTPEQLGGDNPATPNDKLQDIKLLEVTLVIPKSDEDATQREELKGLVYIFDENKDKRGSAFLGIFSVEQQQNIPNGLQVTLQAAQDLSAEEANRIQNAMRSTWAVYTTVPLDRQDIFEELTDEEKEQIPEALRETLTNPERTPKDFNELLSLFYQRRVELKESIDSTQRRIDELNAALEIAKKESQDIRNDQDLEKKRIEMMKIQSKTLRENIDAYDNVIKQLRDEIEKTQTQNEWLVAKIAEYQDKAKELIEQKTAQAAGK
ncbi:MAG: hypothetical protein LBC20_08125 [Planctomycetaceae bacterium]|jgi:sugar-specific transcriptional regulator TrmB|nr:hypothetical protein [Planctomycetaceae bacterium]